MSVLLSRFATIEEPLWADYVKSPLCTPLTYIVAGHRFPTGAVAFLVGAMLFCTLTVAITNTPPDERELSPALRRRLWLQTAVVLLFIAVTGYTALAFHGVISERQAYIPIWSPLVEWAGEAGYRLLGGIPAIGSPALSLSNPVRYFVLPLLVLLLLGARLGELGFGRGHRTGLVLLLWCSIPLALWVFQIVSGVLAVPQLGQRL